MKRYYQAPYIEYSEFDMQQILAGSPEHSFNPNEAPETNMTEGNLSRDFQSIWDDDIDE
jgi:hypothetical protein